MVFEPLLQAMMVGITARESISAQQNTTKAPVSALSRVMVTMVILTKLGWPYDRSVSGRFFYDSREGPVQPITIMKRA